MEKPVKARIDELRRLISRHLKLKEWAKKAKEYPDATPKSIEQAENLTKTLSDEIEDFRAEMYTLMAQVSIPESEQHSAAVEGQEEIKEHVPDSQERIRDYKNQLILEQEIKIGTRKMIEATKGNTEVVNNDLLILYHDSIVKIEYLRMLILLENQKIDQEIYRHPDDDSSSKPEQDPDGYSLPKFMDLTTDKIRAKIQSSMKMIKSAVDIEEQKRLHKANMQRISSIKGLTNRSKPQPASADEGDRPSLRSMLLNMMNLSVGSHDNQAGELIDYLRQSIIIYERWLKKNSVNSSYETNEDVKLLVTYSKTSVVSGCLRIKLIGITELDKDLIKDSKACQVEKSRGLHGSSLFLNDHNQSLASIYLEVKLDHKKIYTSPSCTCSKNCINSKSLEINLLKNKDIEFIVKSSLTNVMVGLTTVTLLEFLDGEKHKLKIPLIPQGYVYCKVQYFLPKPRKARVVRQKEIFVKRRALLKDGNITDIRYLDILKNLRIDKNIQGFTVPERHPAHKHVDDFKTVIPADLEEKRPYIPDIEGSHADAQQILLGHTEIEIYKKIQSNAYKIDISCFVMKNVLGEGHFGKVILVELSKTKDMYALKALTKLSIIENQDYEMLTVEKRVLMLASIFKHPFLLHMLACFSTLHHICYALEYISGGDLLAHVNLHIFSQTRTAFYSGCILLALEFLHNNGVMYRDLKLDNVLMTAEGYVKLGDFGLCKTNMWHNIKTYTFCGTPEFIAPEVLTEGGYTRTVDWWELGVLMYEMLVGEAPFEGEDQEGIFDAITSEEVKLPPYLSKIARDIIFQLLDKNPRTRLGSREADAKDIKAHKFFSQLNFDDLYLKKIKPEYIPQFKDGQMTFVDPDFAKLEPVLLPPKSSYPPIHADQEKFFDCFYYSAI